MNKIMANLSAVADHGNSQAAQSPSAASAYACGLDF
jgi:hypothetical protein